MDGYSACTPALRTRPSSPLGSETGAIQVTRHQRIRSSAQRCHADRCAGTTGPQSCSVVIVASVPMIVVSMAIVPMIVVIVAIVPVAIVPVIVRGAAFVV